MFTSLSARHRKVTRSVPGTFGNDRGCGESTGRNTACVAELSRGVGWWEQVSVCVCGHESHGWTEKGLGDPCSRDILTDLAWRHNVDHWTGSSVVVVEVTVGGNGGRQNFLSSKQNMTSMSAHRPTDNCRAFSQPPTLNPSSVCLFVRLLVRELQLGRGRGGTVPAFRRVLTTQPSISHSVLLYQTLIFHSASISTLNITTSPPSLSPLSLTPQNDTKMSAVCVLFVLT